MYDSAIVDAYGRILQRAIIPEGGRATLIADVPLGTADSIFVELGPWFGWGTLPASIGLPTCRPPPTPTRPPEP